MKPVLRLLVVSALCLLLPAFGAAQEIPSPESFFGFEPGADRSLFTYEKMIEYLEKLDAASDRLELREVGESPLGRPMFVAFLSSPENLAHLDELREINRRLALEHDMDDATRATLATDGRAFVMATLSMHSGEVGPSQSLPLFAHQIAIAEDETVLDQLAEVVLMIVPCHNPDGMDMVVKNYHRYLGTKYEAASLPGVYHQYVGHDNNRDFITLSQSDTRVISHLYSTEWYPQVLVEKHQMGSTGPRYFVPPNHDPIAENIAPELWNWTGTFGAGMARDMSADGLSGVAQRWLFDNYWPGSTETSLWKNVISFLTEAASCKTATPIRVEPNELRVRGKGLSEYAKSTNMPDPWPGGWWRLSDIVDYELSSTYSILATAASHREAILEVRNTLGRDEVRRGRTEAPFYFVMPRAQHDSSALWRLTDLLVEHGVEVFQLSEPVTVDGQALAAGDVVVPLAQPYRAFVKEVLEAQRYPVRHYTPRGDVIKPYDITSWSLPLHYGVRSIQMDTRCEKLEAALVGLERDRVEVAEETRTVVLPSNANGSFSAAFAALGKDLTVHRLRETLAVEGTDIPAGSFVINAKASAAATLSQVVADADAPVIVTSSLPEVSLAKLKMPRVALVETWFHDMDAGWTRFVFDSSSIPFTVLRPAEMADIDLGGRFDVVVLPDAEPEVLLKGRYKTTTGYRSNSYPPEYQKGMGDDGLQRLLTFLDGGGTVISWRRSSGLFTGELELGEDDDVEHFSLPIRDLTSTAKEHGLLVPGAFLKISVNNDHPLGWGMPETAGVFSRGTPVLQTTVPIFDTDRRVVAAYAQRDLLLSGYAENSDELAGKPAAIWVTKGKGQLVLFTFNPQFRASTPVTYKLLFNALLLPEPETS